MSDEPQDLNKSIQDLIISSVREQARAVERYSELAQRIVRGELDERTVREEFIRFARDETMRYLRNFATLSLSYYTALLELGLSYQNRFFERVLGATNNENVTTPRAAPPQRVEIELRAQVGQEVTSSFVIENKRSEKAEISFLISEFVGPPETAPFRPPLQLKPPRFTLDPREEGVVTLTLPLLPELFTPGQSYTAKIVVGGYDDMELNLSVFPEAPPVPEEVSSAPGAPETEIEADTAPGEPALKPRRSRQRARRGIANDQSKTRAAGADK
jgi:hypothetical protein